jgi:hypothetical protein
MDDALHTEHVPEFTILLFCLDANHTLRVALIIINPNFISFRFQGLRPLSLRCPIPFFFFARRSIVFLNDLSRLALLESALLVSGSGSSLP